MVEQSRKVGLLSRILFFCKGIGLFVMQRSKPQYQKVEDQLAMSKH